VVILYVEIKCQLDTTEVFIADLIDCSTCFGHHYAHHQELKIIIQWLLPVVFRAVIFKLLVWCGTEGYVSGLQDAEPLLHLVGILYPHINEDARSKSHQIWLYYVACSLFVYLSLYWLMSLTFSVRHLNAIKSTVGRQWT
jgi:hypothetical protein